MKTERVMSDTRPESSRPAAGPLLDELAPLIDVIPLYGPPVVFFASPWVLFALLLAGPFALLMTIVLALIVAGLVLVAMAAIVASPYLLVRHLRSTWASRAPRAATAPVSAPAH